MVFVVEETEQKRRYSHRQNRKGLLWCGLNRGDKLRAE